MKMLYATCVPHLTYASDIIQYSVNQMHSMNVALNDCLHQVFIYNHWASLLAHLLRIPITHQNLREEIYEVPSTAPTASQSNTETLLSKAKVYRQYTTWLVYSKTISKKSLKSVTLLRIVVMGPD